MYTTGFLPGYVDSMLSSRVRLPPPPLFPRGEDAQHRPLYLSLSLRDGQGSVSFFTEVLRVGRTATVLFRGSLPRSSRASLDFLSALFAAEEGAPFAFFPLNNLLRQRIPFH